MRKLSAIGALVLWASTMLVTAAPAGNADAATSPGTVIATAPSPFGTILVVGSGQYAGYSVYTITSDAPPNYGCTTTVQPLPGFPGPGSCTGPEGDQTAEWPAATTTGAPVAGKGVEQRLLGTVVRPGIGEQVTYAGHPLYLFDSAPHQLNGEGWDEPGLPPWHGVWYAVSPKGVPVVWTPMLNSASLASGKKVLTVSMLTGGGWQAVPVYTDSAAKGCTGSCALVWPPLLTGGQPGVAAGIAPAIGTRRLSDGSLQVTYHGRPLYLYGDETPIQQAGGLVIVGSGNDKSAGSGVFHLVAG